MRTTDYIILFLMVTLMPMISLDQKFQELTIIQNQKLQYARAMENAVDDAVSHLIGGIQNEHTSLNYRESAEYFFEAFARNLGRTDPAFISKIRKHIPVVLVTDTHGYYISYYKYEKKGDEWIQERKWTEKMPYRHMEDNYIIDYSLDNNVTLSDANHTIIAKGNYQDVRNIHPHYLLEDIIFDTFRRTTIIHVLIQNMEYYMNEFNTAGNQFGFHYNFFLPDIPVDEWNRTIDDIAMLVIYQDYPYYSMSNERYGRHMVRAARIYKRRHYYVETAEEGKRYHREDCTKLLYPNEVYNSRRECALAEAFACEHCRP